MARWHWVSRMCCFAMAMSTATGSKAHTIGGEAFEARAAEYAPDRERDLRMPAEEVEMLAELMATQTPTLIKTSDGVQHYQNDRQTIRAIASLPALLWQYGVRGGRALLLVERSLALGRRGGRCDYASSSRSCFTRSIFGSQIRQMLSLSPRSSTKAA
jgi:hypothetical protein